MIFALCSRQFCRFCGVLVGIGKVTTRQQMPKLPRARKQKMKKYNAENAASDFLDGLCEPHGWSLADLAKMSGYRLETLQKVRRGHTDTPLTDKMRRHLLNTSNLAAGIAEESPPYRVRLIEPGGPPGGREVSIPATTEAGLIAEGMEIFGDLKIASKTSRRVLLKRLREILDEIEHPKIQTQQQSQ